MKYIPFATIGHHIRISRPRFWIYILGPFLIGYLAGWEPQNHFFTAPFFVRFFYFLFPANLFLYGINDYFDYEIDQHNEKKKGYETFLQKEERGYILFQLIKWNLPFLLFILTDDLVLGAILVGYILLGYTYSGRPTRWKTVPFMDSLSNGLYIFPGLFGYALSEGTERSWMIIAAGRLRSSAMHAYSAIPDIKADSEQGISTIATVLGKKYTLIYCGLLYGISALLFRETGGRRAILGGSMYIIMMILTYVNSNPFKLYKTFPIINTCVGMALFFLVLSMKFS